MRNLFLLQTIAWLVWLTGSTSAVILSQNINPGATLCYYADVQHKGLVVNFYYSVYSGGNFDLNYEILSPTGRRRAAEQKLTNVELMFKAETEGEYSFCFHNPTSKLSFDGIKGFNFEIVVEKERKMAELPTKTGSTPEQAMAIERGLSNVSNKLMTLTRMQKAYRAREARNFSTVRSTHQWIHRTSIGQIFLILLYAAFASFQIVFTVSRARKSYV